MFFFYFFIKCSLKRHFIHKSKYMYIYLIKHFYYINCAFFYSFFFLSYNFVIINFETKRIFFCFIYKNKNQNILAFVLFYNSNSFYLCLKNKIFIYIHHSICITYYLKIIKKYLLTLYAVVIIYLSNNINISI